ncbi:hypothetical protein [Ekhidna sp.]
MKKQLLIFGLLVFSAASLSAQSNYQDTTKHYSFQVNYWFNLHHFLWLESFMNVSKDSTIISQTLSKVSQKKLDISLAYYREKLASQDLRTSDYMTEFKHWITKGDNDLSMVPSEFQAHVDMLKNVSDIYQKYFWPSHEKSCINSIKENIGLIRKTEEKFVDEITTLTRQFWQSEKLKVDVTYVGKATKWNPRNLPYTSLFPTHVVMNTVGTNDTKGNWIELLYHESAHHLILSNSYFIGGTLNDIGEVMDVKLPRQLGHSYLFYFTGQLTKKLLEESSVSYPSTYMERNGIFSKYYPYLDVHLKAYMNREVTLTEASESIIKDLQE